MQTTLLRTLFCRVSERLMGLFFWHALPTLQQNKFEMAGVQAKMVTNKNLRQKEKFCLLASEKKRGPHVKYFYCRKYYQKRKM